MSGTHDPQQNQNSVPVANQNTGKPKKKKLTQERLKELLHYDPETGVFTWAMGRPGASKGNEAGWVDHRGYKLIQISGKNYRAHRLVWFYVNGYFPEGGIDHINSNPLDNRLSNLRAVSQQCNVRNSKVQRRSSTGIKGVIVRRDIGKYSASIVVKGVRTSLGCFSCLVEAAAHRYAAEQCLDWSGCDVKGSARNFLTEHLETRS